MMAAIYGTMLLAFLLAELRRPGPAVSALGCQVPALQQFGHGMLVVVTAVRAETNASGRRSGACYPQALQVVRF